MADEGDVRERLLPSSPPRASRGDDADSDDEFTHEELLHSIGSFSAVVWPVALTMVLSRSVARAHCELVLLHARDQGAYCR